MDCITEKKGDFLVVRVNGRMDAVTAPDFEKTCAEAIDTGETALVVDLGGLEYISSAGLRGILATAKKLKACQGRIAFANLSGMVQEVFAISGFTAMFSVYKTVEEATGA